MPLKGKKDNTLNWLKKFRNFDLFGHRISFTYENADTFKSTFGAVVTILFILSILIYFSVLVIEMMQNTTFTVIDTIQKQKMTFDQSKVYLNKNNFDMAIFLYYNGEQTIQDNLDLYFQYNIQQIQMEWVTDPSQIEEIGNNYQWSMNNLTLELCDETRFGGDIESARQLGMIGRYYCLNNDFNITMFGSWSSQKSKIIQVLVHYCEQEYLDRKYPGQNKSCKSKEEADQIIGKMQVNLNIMTQYFDQKEFSASPIKNIIQADLYSTLHPNISNNRVFKVTRHELYLKDSWLSNIKDVDPLSFYDYEFLHAYLGEVDVTQNNPLMTFQFILHENIHRIERISDTIFTVLSKVGGLISAAFLITKFSISWIQKRLFYNSAIKRLFLARSNLMQSDLDITGKAIINQNDTQMVRKGEQDDKIDVSFGGKRKNDYHLKIQPINVEELNCSSPSPMSQSKHLDSVGELFDSDMVKTAILYIKSLRPFGYSFQRYLRLLCKKQQNQSGYDKSYLRGVRLLEEKFDIINLFQSMKCAKVMEDIMLTRKQVKLIPFLRINVLDDSLQDIKTSQKEMNTQFLEIEVRELFKNANNGKQQDKKILKKLVVYNKQQLESNRKQLENKQLNRRSVSRISISQETSPMSGVKKKNGRALSKSFRSPMKETIKRSNSTIN